MRPRARDLCCQGVCTWRGWVWRKSRWRGCQRGWKRDGRGVEKETEREKGKDNDRNWTWFLYIFI